MPQTERGGYLKNDRVPCNVRESESVFRISTILLKHFPIASFKETEHFDHLDKRGVDLILLPESLFSQMIGMEEINVQVKSSETGLDGFFSKGKKINGCDGKQWRELNLVALNGQWPEDMITADFFYQLINLIGIPDNEFEINDLLDFLKPYVRQSYARAMAKGLLDQYRGEMADWVRGKQVELFAVSDR
jgi:hypothetical protein